MSPLGEHFFRREFGKLVAGLSRRVGVVHLELVEDAAQSALMSAVQVWPTAGLPDNPSAWLFSVARNELLGQLRKRTRQQRLLEQDAGSNSKADDDLPEAYFAGELADDLLRMLFICCDEQLPPESRVVLALRTLCGFDVREISLRLFSSEANVYKRLGRARARLREFSSAELSGRFSELDVRAYSARLPAVREVLYLMFTEGYLSSHAELAIRRDLCNEALRLTTTLAEHSWGETPESHALLALMHLQAARMSARQDDTGGLLLLEEQDRTRWDMVQVEVGLQWLSRSARGEALSRYHAEAGIAAEHCLAPSFDSTRWDKVAEYYALLERCAPTAVHRLNRALAVAQWKDAAAGLALLESYAPPSWLAGSHMWFAVLSDLHRRCGNDVRAESYRTAALDAAPTAAIKELLQRRLSSQQ